MQRWVKSAEISVRGWKPEGLCWRRVAHKVHNVPVIAPGWTISNQLFWKKCSVPESTDRPDSVMRAQNQPTRGRREKGGSSRTVIHYLFQGMCLIVLLVRYKGTSCDRLLGGNNLKGNFPQKLNVIMLHLFFGCSSCEATAQRGGQPFSLSVLTLRWREASAAAAQPSTRSVVSATTSHVHTHAAGTGVYQAFAPRERQQAQGRRRGPSSSTHVEFFLCRAPANHCLLEWERKGRYCIVFCILDSTCRSRRESSSSVLSVCRIWQEHLPTCQHHQLYTNHILFTDTSVRPKQGSQCSKLEFIITTQPII